MDRFYEIYDFPLFASGNRDIIDDFLKDVPSRISSYKKGDIVVLQNSPCKSLMLLCQGRLSARMTSTEGREITIETLEAPEVLAPAFIYGSDNRFPVTLISEGNSVVWTLAKDEFLKLMEKDKGVLGCFLKNISDRSVFLSKKLNEFALQSLSTRIVSYLKHNGKISNVQELAFIMGVARPSLSRMLSSMLESGIIEKNEYGYILSDKPVK